MTVDAEQHRRRKSPECLSDFQLDCLLVGKTAGDLDAVEQQAWEAHIATCDLCAEKLSHLQARHEQFPAELPLPVIASETLLKVENKTKDRKAPWAWLTGAFAAAAAAAAIVLAVVSTDPLVEDDMGTRLKGKPSFGVYVKRSAKVFKGESNGNYLAGDRIRFDYTSKDAVFFGVASIDPAQTVSQFVPPAGDQPLELKPASDGVIGGGIELDDTMGTEQLLGAFCPTPFSMAQLLVGLKNTGVASTKAMNAETIGLDERCTVQTFVLNKVPRLE
ncbi:anti-sigma factor family protein [Myxococcota bacterium]